MVEQTVQLFEHIELLTERELRLLLFKEEQGE